MSNHLAELEQHVPLRGLLGYLNLSEGRPDSRFQKQLSDIFAFFASRGVAEPWSALRDSLRLKLTELKAGENAAFRNAAQVEGVIAATLDHGLAAYRTHHRDLLFHLTDVELFQPFFIARFFEAALAQGSPWDETDRIVGGAIHQLNDFVGYRPIAVLENRPRGEPYEHERVRPIPLFIQGGGVAFGPYQELLAKTLELIATTNAAVLFEAGLDVKMLDEWSLDPRAYDHGHPTNRRPNYVFGEWDPSHLDNQGRFRRYVTRKVTLDAIMDRLANPGEVAADEAMFEAAAVLAGSVLMGTGVTGPSPTAYDSTVSLATLVPRIARYRDAFYSDLLKKVSGPHRERLEREAKATKQPFGGARQHLNHYLARQRALQVQQRHLALVFANLGHPEASREQAARIPAASVRMLSEIVAQLTTGQLLSEKGKLDEAAALLPQIEDLIHRGIDCGAMVDPWNILGFQGQFPIFATVQDSVHDQRIDELVRVVEQTFHLYARLLSEAAATGNLSLRNSLRPPMRALADWWDQFASVEVSGVLRIHGGEAAQSAEHVAGALTKWHERGAVTADLGFWRQHLEGFTTPKAFVLVVDALLQKEDYRASMALLMNWLSQVEQVPLEEGHYTFHALAVRWMLGVLKQPGDPWPLVKKFFDYLEANAETFWEVPELDVLPQPVRRDDEDEEEGTFAAAYEEMTYQDSTDDGTEGSLQEEGPPLAADFDLQEESERLGKRLRFLLTLAGLWQIAARQSRRFQHHADWLDAHNSWRATAENNRAKLLDLLDALHLHVIPEPMGSYDSLVEYDRRRVLKEELVETVIAASRDTALAIRSLRGNLDDFTTEAVPNDESALAAAWEPLAIRLEQALVRNEADHARKVLPLFTQLFEKEPLLYAPLDAGGNPRQILRVRIAQMTLRALLEGLPRLGLLRETFHLLKTARAMEGVDPPAGRRVTEFDRVFQVAFQAVVEAVVESATSWETPMNSPRVLAEALETVSSPFMALWVEHSRTLRLSPVEGVVPDSEWKHLRDFIRKYGNDLFTARFMSLGNLRGILHGGIGPHLDYLNENPDPLHPIRLIDELDAGKINRDRAVQLLEVVLQIVVDNFEEYRDYNSTTTQSDYGENLHLFLDFIRLKAAYDRHAWHFRPLVMVHEVLAREGHTEAAVFWEQGFRHFTKELADRQLDELGRREQHHGIRLRTVRDRLEERFTKPLALDRLCALIEPAMAEARTGAEDGTFAFLQHQLEEYTANPIGVGLDVPHWLRRLEGEVHRIRMKGSVIAGLAEELFYLPRTKLSLDELKRQLQNWEKPLLGE